MAVLPSKTAWSRAAAATKWVEGQRASFGDRPAPGRWLPNERIKMRVGSPTAILSRTIGSTTTDVQWTYAMAELVVDSSGAWADLVGGRTVDAARNCIEDGNSSGDVLSGLYDFASEPFLSNPAIQLKPVAGIPVDVEVRYKPDGTPTFWFSAPNGVQGSCGGGG